MHIINRINDHITLGILDLAAFSAHFEISHKRECEKAGTNYLLEKMLNTPLFNLQYSAENKPLLHGKHLSISHSHDKLAIIINTQYDTGIDIELVRDKVKQVEHKFLNPDESALASSETPALITFWAVKEALYKLYGKKSLDFRQHLFIEAIDNNNITARIEAGDFKKSYRLICQDIENYKLVYVLNEI